MVGRFMYWMNVSLDLRIEQVPGDHGAGEWLRITEELHREFNTRARDLALMVQGRIVHELMEEYWPRARQDESLPEVLREYGEIWCAAPKVLVSRTRTSAEYNTRIIGGDDAIEQLAVLRDQTEGTIGVGGAQVEHRDQHVGEHVAGDEDPVFADQQRRMARRVRPMFEDPDFGSVPGDPSRSRRQAGDQAQQIQRHLSDDLRRQLLHDVVPPLRIRQEGLDRGGAAGRAVAGRRTEIGVPEQVIPMRMGGKPCHHRLSGRAQVTRDGFHVGAGHPGIDEQHARVAVHENGIGLETFTLVQPHPGRDLFHHEPAPLWSRMA